MHSIAKLSGHKTKYIIEWAVFIPSTDLTYSNGSQESGSGLRMRTISLRAARRDMLRDTQAESVPTLHGH